MSSAADGSRLASRPPRAPLAAGLALSLATACATLGGAHTAPPPAPTSWRYDVALSPDLGELRARVCFEGAAPSALIPGITAGAAFVRGAHLEEPGAAPRRLTVRDGAIALGPARAGSCVRYAVDLKRALREGPSNRALGVGRDVVVSPSIWLWRPSRIALTVDARVRLALPPGVAASVPWAPVPGREHEYALDATALRWESYTAFGRFRPEVVPVPGGALAVTVLDGPHAASGAGIRRWLTTAGGAVASLFGTFPAARTQVLIAPVAGWSAPVSFGLTSRGGGASVLLFLNEHARDDELPGEWVALHEFLHLVHPVLRDEDAWLSEGLATYYQEVLRARAGLRSPTEAWDALVEGFARGRRDATGRSLAAESAMMAFHSAYAQVYWGGTAMVFLADVRVRERTGGRRSLDDLVRALRQCCRDSDRVWTADEVAARMDAVAGVPVLRELMAEHLEAREFPPLEGVFEALGVAQNGRAATPRTATAGWVRDGIMGAAVGGGPR